VVELKVLRATVLPTVEHSPQIQTDRLILRRWREADLAPFAVLNSNPRVCQFLPGPLTREQSDDLASRIAANFDRYGFGLWAVEVLGGEPFIGFIGLSVPRFESHFMPCVEIGWRLSSDHWGHGYATEGARAVLAFAFDVAGLREIVSFTVPDNTRSRRVMAKVGMKHDPAEDFDHPFLAEGDRLRRHVLHRISRPETAS
jgi:ribosomal-protein-alanine N-acetyltransferase